MTHAYGAMWHFETVEWRCWSLACRRGPRTWNCFLGCRCWIRCCADPSFSIPLLSLGSKILQRSHFNWWVLDCFNQLTGFLFNWLFSPAFGNYSGAAFTFLNFGRQHISLEVWTFVMSEQSKLHQYFASRPTVSVASPLAASPVLPCPQLSQAQLDRIQKQKDEALRRRATLTIAGNSANSLASLQNDCPSSTLPTSKATNSVGSSLVNGIVSLNCVFRLIWRSGQGWIICHSLWI
jgi:hypothetical protein